MDAHAARSLLEQERARLQTLQRGLQHEGLADTSEAQASDVLAPLDQHQADMASEVFEREKDLSILHRVELDLRDVADALDRLDAGTYGTCATCAADIGMERLTAVPATRYCAEHEGMWEGDKLTLTMPAGAYVDDDARGAERVAAREAGRNLDLLPDDDEVVERVELGPEQNALHLTDPARPNPEALTADEVAVLEQRHEEWAEQERSMRAAALDEAEER